MNVNISANTQYGDYTGLISIDKNESIDLFHELAKEFLLSVKVNLHNLAVVFYATQSIK